MKNLTRDQAIERLNLLLHEDVADILNEQVKNAGRTR